MKKLLTTAILLATTMLVSAQEQEKDEKFNIEKGTWNISGYLSFSINNQNNETYDVSDYERDNSSITIKPSTEYFIKDNLSLGVSLSYGYGYTDQITSDTEYTSNIYGVSPYIKKYVPLNKNFGFSFLGELGYTYSENKNSTDFTDYIDRTTQNQFSAAIRPGLVFFATKNLALNANIGALQYTYLKAKSGEFDQVENTYQGFNFNFNNLYFGLSYYL